MTQPEYGQQPGYGQQPAYGQPAYGQQPGYGQQQAPEHPQAQVVLILGIVGIFFGILSFVAWYMGGQAKKEIEAGAPYPWDGNLKIGYLLGKIFSIIWIVIGVLYVIGIIGLFMLGAAAQR
ncbi:MAG: hypothetical protein CSA64_04480 [Arachnia propionica]|nr:MAG: hypothetical protein CSA64_04480 [Arachnia propionica]